MTLRLLISRADVSLTFLFLLVCRAKLNGQQLDIFVVNSFSSGFQVSRKASVDLGIMNAAMS